MDEIKELHDRKNSDYASDTNPYSNFEFSAKIVEQFTSPVDQVFAGIIGIKIARLGQLLGVGKSPKNESIRDTMRDLTTYCGIWCSYRSEMDDLKEQLRHKEELYNQIRNKNV